MSIIDSLFLTFVSTIACIVLPKFLSTFAQDSKQVEATSKSTSLKQGSSEVPSFPY